MTFATVINIDRSTSGSTIRRLAYAVDERVLEVAFATTNGLSVYRYPDVPYEVFHGLCHAQSVTRSVSVAIKGLATFTKNAPKSLAEQAVRVVSLRRRAVPAEAGLRGLLFGLNEQTKDALRSWARNALFG